MAVLILCCMMVLWHLGEAMNGKGLTPLDSTSFEKITSKFQATLIKFDKYFPYGSAHDEFLTVATNAANYMDFLVAEVGVKDYGDRDNEDLMQRFHLSNEDLPAVFLYFPDGREPVRFSDEITSKGLERFCRRYAGWSLPGTITELDKLARKLIDAPSEHKGVLLQEARGLVSNLQSKGEANYYILVMEKVISDGIEFLTKEKHRVQAVISGKLSDQKRGQMERRLNVLEAFTVDQDDGLKDEL